MTQLVADCPRCGAGNIAFEFKSYTRVAVAYSWQSIYEAFCICSNCFRSTTFIIEEIGIDQSKEIKQFGLLHDDNSSANNLVRVTSFVSEKDGAGQDAPEHVPEGITDVFDEGATCIAVGCFNAAGCMFRLCVDLATEPLLPVENVDGLNSKIRRSLGLRLEWLFNTKRLPEAMRELSTCIKEDGNDGAHAGTLRKEDAQDLLDFTVALLEQMYTQPERLRLAKERRTVRREPKT